MKACIAWTASSASPSPTAGMAASVASTAGPMACAIRSSRRMTATVSHDMDNGSLLLWARALDDKNQFITPTAILQGSGSNYSSFPGIDALTGTYYSKAMQHVQVPGPYGNMLNADLANGRGGKLNYFG